MLRAKRRCSTGRRFRSASAGFLTYDRKKPNNILKNSSSIQIDFVFVFVCLSKCKCQQSSKKGREELRLSSSHTRCVLKWTCCKWARLLVRCAIRLAAMAREEEWAGGGGWRWCSGGGGGKWWWPGSAGPLPPDRWCCGPPAPPLRRTTNGLQLRRSTAPRCLYRILSRFGSDAESCFGRTQDAKWESISMRLNVAKIISKCQQTFLGLFICLFCSTFYAKHTPCCQALKIKNKKPNKKRRWSRGLPYRFCGVGSRRRNCPEAVGVDRDEDGQCRWMKSTNTTSWCRRRRCCCRCRYLLSPIRWIIATQILCWWCIRGQRVK